MRLKNKFWNIRKTATILAILLMVICLVGTPLFVFAFSSKELTGSGSILFSRVPVVPSTPEAMETQETMLEAGGFSVKINSGSGIMTVQKNSPLSTLSELKRANYTLRGYKCDEDGNLLAEDGTVLSGLTMSDDELIANGLAVSEHDPILSFAIYENSPCMIEKELIVILDFSQFAVSRFTSNALDGIVPILFGLENVFSYTLDVAVYDAVSGLVEETKKVTMNGHYTIDGETEHDYALRIVLPNVGIGKEIDFKEQSLYLPSWYEQLASYPRALTFDLSRMPLNRAQNLVSGLTLNKNMTVGTVDGVSVTTIDHCHFIGHTNNQLEYALYNALDHVKESNFRNMTYEIFRRRSFEEELSQLSTRISYDTGNNAPVIDVIDSSSVTSKSDLVNMLAMAYWIQYVMPSIEKIDTVLVYHERRNVDQSLGDKARFYIRRDSSDGLIEYEIDGQIWYLLECDHLNDGSKTIIGLFTQKSDFYYYYQQGTFYHSITDAALDFTLSA